MAEGVPIPVPTHPDYRCGENYWIQMWSPCHDPKTVPYGEPHIMRLDGMHRYDDEPGILRFRFVDPKRPRDVSQMSWLDTSWCDITPAEPLQGTLF